MKLLEQLYSKKGVTLDKTEYVEAAWVREIVEKLIDEVLSVDYRHDN